MIGIKNWLLGKLLEGRVMLFENNGELTPINDITIENNFLLCRYDPRDIEERFEDLDE